MSSIKTHVRKDDTVMVITGKDAGKKGKVIEVIPSKGKIVVEGVSVVKRHTKPTQGNPQGGIMEKPAAIDSSNVMLLCGKCNKVTRIKMKSQDNGKMVRVCTHCQEVFDK